MADKLNIEEEKATKQFLELVNAKRREHNASPVAWNTALRFLMARKFDVRRAVDLYNSHEDVRRREGINIIDPFEESVRRELLTEKFTVLNGRDSANAAIALFTARLHFPPHTTHQAVLKSLIFQLDGALESVDTQRNGLVFIYDMSGSKYANFDYELSIKILSLLKGSYPARLKKVLIVTAPLWFKAPFKILRLFVREKLRDRVHTASLNQLPLHIPMNALPRRLGGHAEIYHHAWLSVCLKLLHNAHHATATAGTNSNNDVGAFFENIDNNHVTPSLDRLTSSMSSGVSSVPTTPNGDDSCFYSNSDMDSDVSKDTLTDKSSLTNGGNDKDSTCVKNDISRTKSPPSGGGGRGKSPPLKRNHDSSSLSSSGDQSSKKRSVSTSDYEMVDEDSVHTGEGDGMTIKELVEMVKAKGRRGLYQEYAYIKGEPPNGSFEVSKARYNLPKNRYTDVLCLDHSRVRLAPVEGDLSSDYINANFVDSYKHKNAYISTQGPLPRTFPDFWRMIWEQKVIVVVMTTRTVERSRLKCGQYWPLDEETAEDFGDFIVINNNVDKRKDYTVTHLLIQNIKTQESRKITHFQFTSWPDYGVPRTAAAFLDFMTHVREHQAERVRDMDDGKGNPLGPPIVVHCSAGIGRTGTFIAMNINTLRLADVGTVEVQETVRKIRSQRAFSIQMPDQYVFSHTALIEHAQAEGLLSGSDMDGLDESSSDSD